jgi:hypothetical protein
MQHQATLQQQHQQLTPPGQLLQGRQVPMHTYGMRPRSSTPQGSFVQALNTEMATGFRGGPYGNRAGQH